MRFTLHSFRFPTRPSERNPVGKGRLYIYIYVLTHEISFGNFPVHKILPTKEEILCLDIRHGTRVRSSVLEKAILVDSGAAC